MICHNLLFPLMKTTFKMQTNNVFSHNTFYRVVLHLMNLLPHYLQLPITNCNAAIY